MHHIKRIPLLILSLTLPFLSMATGGDKNTPDKDGEKAPVKNERVLGNSFSRIAVAAGIKSGLTYSSISIAPPVQNAASRYGRSLMTSAFVVFTAPTGTELSIGAGYLSQSAILEVHDSTTQDWILNFDYISVPIVLHYPFYYDEFANDREFKIYTLIGVEVNSTLQVYRDLTQDQEGFVVSDNLTSGVHRVEGGITGGAGMSVGITSTVNWVLDGRAYFGLTNFNKDIPLTDASLNMNHNRFQVATGLSVKF